MNRVNRVKDPLCFPPPRAPQLRKCVWWGGGVLSSFSVGALSSLSALWMACVTTGAVSVAGSQEQIHYIRLRGLSGSTGDGVKMGHL